MILKIGIRPWLNVPVKRSKYPDGSPNFMQMLAQFRWRNRVPDDGPANWHICRINAKRRKRTHFRRPWSHRRASFLPERSGHRGISIGNCTRRTLYDVLLAPTFHYFFHGMPRVRCDARKRFISLCNRHTSELHGESTVTSTAQCCGRGLWRELNYK